MQSTVQNVRVAGRVTCRPWVCSIALGTLVLATPASADAQPEPAPRRAPAPTGYRELKLGAPRQQIREIARGWGDRLVASQYPQGGQLLAFPNDTPEEAFLGCLFRFEDDQGLYAGPAYRRNARLLALTLETKPFPVKQSASFVKSFVDRYGRWTAIDERADPLQNPEDFVQFLSYPGNKRAVTWHWGPEDSRLHLLLAGGYEQAVALISYDAGYGARLQSAAVANGAMKRILREREDVRMGKIRDALAGGQQKPAAQPKQTISFLDQRFEARTVVSVVAVHSFNGQPWSEMREALAASIEALPNGVHFQVNGAVPPHGLLRVTEDTRLLARHFVQYGGEDFGGGAFIDDEWTWWKFRTDQQSLAETLRTAIDLKPELLIVATNLARIAASPLPAAVGDLVRRAKSHGTTVQVFCWKFPGPLDMTAPQACEDQWPLPPPAWTVPEEWRTIARETGGRIRAYGGSQYFWGTGPRVTLRYRCRPTTARPEEERTATGQLIFADEEFVGIQTEKEHRRWVMPRDRVASLRVVGPAAAHLVPTHVRKHLPQGSVKPE